VFHEHYHGRDDIIRPELVAINLTGDAIHNFIDGLMIGASYLVSPRVGQSTTIAVLLHEIPQEFGDFGILIHSGLRARTAVLLNLASASRLPRNSHLIAGGFRRSGNRHHFLASNHRRGFVYLAAADLIPVPQHDRSFRALVGQTVLISSGIAIMGLLTLVK
jgi:zinc and cadmium transporter